MVRRKYSKREIFFGAAASLLTIAVLAFYLWHITEDIHLGYAINRAEAKRQQLQTDIKILKTKKAALLSLDIVEKKAREGLGLTDARDGQIIYKDY